MALRYAVAIWNFTEPGVQLLDLVEEFCTFGLDAVSFSSGQLGKVEPSEWEAVGKLLRERSMAATLHCSFGAAYDGMQAVISSLGESLHAVTFDPAVLQDTPDRRYDWERMSPVLAALEEGTRNTSVRFGVEDFPLSAAALDVAKDCLPAAVRECPRWGILLDLGHMNMRWHQQPDRQSPSIEETIRAVPLPIVEVHVHDNAGDKDSHGYIGLGNAPFPAMARGLAAAGFDGISTIEIAPSFHGATLSADKPRVKESFEIWRDLLQKARH